MPLFQGQTGSEETGRGKGEAARPPSIAVQQRAKEFLKSQVEQPVVLLPQLTSASPHRPW